MPRTIFHSSSSSDTHQTIKTTSHQPVPEEDTKPAPKTKRRVNRAKVRYTVGLRLRRSVNTAPPTSYEDCPVRVIGFSVKDATCGLCSFQDDCKVKTLHRLISVVEDLFQNLYRDTGYCGLCPDPIEEPSYFLQLLGFKDWKVLKEKLNHIHSSSGLEAEAIFDVWRENIIEQMNKFIDKIISDSKKDPTIIFGILKAIDPKTSASLSHLVPRWKDAKRLRSEYELRKYCDDKGIEYDKWTIEDVIDKNIRATSKLRQKLIRQYKRDNEDKNRFMNEDFPKETQKGGDKWPTSWMKNSKKIMANLEKWEHAIPILNYMWQHKKPLEESKAISSPSEADIRKYIHNGRNYYRALVHLDREEIAKRVGASKGTVYNYIKGFVDWGILEEHGKHGPKRLMVYSIGYYTESRKYGDRAFSYTKDTPGFRRVWQEFKPKNAR